jgi:hypothetical protein
MKEQIINIKPIQDNAWKYYLTKKHNEKIRANSKRFEFIAVGIIILTAFTCLIFSFSFFTFVTMGLSGLFLFITIVRYPYAWYQVSNKKIAEFLHKTSNHEKKEILLEYLEVVINTFTRDLKQYKNPNNESFEKKLQELGNYMFLKKVIEESQPG